MTTHSIVAVTNPAPNVATILNSAVGLRCGGRCRKAAVSTT
jgi:hypothetical protein